jgi:hypothetical protein
VGETCSENLGAAAKAAGGAAALTVAAMIAAPNAAADETSFLYDLRYGDGIVGNNNLSLLQAGYASCSDYQRGVRW